MAGKNVNGKGVLIIAGLVGLMFMLLHYVQNDRLGALEEAKVTFAAHMNKDERDTVHNRELITRVECELEKFTKRIEGKFEDLIDEVRKSNGK